MLQVTFDLNCGAGIGQAVEAWLQPFLVNNVLGSMFVWPNRLVVRGRQLVDQQLLTVPKIALF